MGNNKSIIRQEDPNAIINKIKLDYDALKKEDSIYGNFRITPEFLEKNIKNKTIYEIKLENTYNYVRVGSLRDQKLFLKIGKEIFNKYKYIISIKINITSTIIDQENIEIAIKNCWCKLGCKIAGKLKLNSNILDSFHGIHCISKYNWNENALHLRDIEYLLPLLKYLKFQILIVVADFNDFAQGKINYEKYFKKNEIEFSGILDTYDEYFKDYKPLKLKT